MTPEPLAQRWHGLLQGSGSPTTIISQENAPQFGQYDRGNSSTKAPSSQMQNKGPRQSENTGLWGKAVTAKGSAKLQSGHYR